MSTQLFAGLAVGLSFGFVMSIVSNGFVMSVRWLTDLREVRIAYLLGLDQHIAALLPLFCLLAAFLILQVRHLFDTKDGMARRQYLCGPSHRQ